MVAAGVDGCRGGWVAVSLKLADSEASLTLRVYPCFAALLEALVDAEAVAVDMPIGLHETGRARPRPCDVVARKRLGKRTATIFMPPTRAMLRGQPYADLRPMGLSVQAYHLIPRIREIDTLITPELQRRVWESHPELSFMAINGAPVALPKRTEAGQQARYALLQRALAPLCPNWWEAVQAFWTHQPRRLAQMDDLLDACVLAWSAWRHTQGLSEACLGEPTHDSRGLEMAIRD